MSKRLAACGGPNDSPGEPSQGGLQLQRRFRKLQFCLQRKKWQDKVMDLGRQIDQVGRLFGEAESLGPARQSSVSATHQAFDQIKRQACSLHQAITQGWVCKCRDLHVNLVMANRTKRSVSPKPPSPEFKVAFPLQPQSWTTADMAFTRQDAGNTFDTTMSSHFDKVVPTHVLPSADGVSTISSRVDTMSLTPSLFSTASKSTMPSSLISPAEYSQEQSKETVLTVTAGGKPFPVENLCEVIQARDLPRRSRMRIALAISYAILEFYPTPWLQDTCNKMDVRLLQRRDAEIMAESPFIPYQSSSSSGGPSCKQIQRSDDHSNVLLALGIIILELWLGRNIESCAFWKEHCDHRGAERKFTNFMAALEWQIDAIAEAGITQH
ncbi:hypothetical protein S40288_00307 [Stachybotrys chartarum IBT 40288]|nr:hypothetical protein S40288_00307 [Stachybotrys chartarum IBT 40288]